MVLTGFLRPAFDAIARHSHCFLKTAGILAGSSVPKKLATGKSPEPVPTCRENACPTSKGTGRGRRPPQLDETTHAADYHGFEGLERVFPDCHFIGKIFWVGQPMSKRLCQDGGDMNEKFRIKNGDWRGKIRTAVADQLLRLVPCSRHSRRPLFCGFARHYECFTRFVNSC